MSVTYSMGITRMRLKHWKQRKKRPTHARFYIPIMPLKVVTEPLAWYTDPCTVHRHWQGCRLLWR